MFRYVIVLFALFLASFSWHDTASADAGRTSGAAEGVLGRHYPPPTPANQPLMDEALLNDFHDALIHPLSPSQLADMDAKLLRILLHANGTEFRRLLAEKNYEGAVVEALAWQMPNLVPQAYEAAINDNEFVRAAYIGLVTKNMKFITGAFGAANKAGDKTAAEQIEAIIKALPPSIYLPKGTAKSTPATARQKGPQPAPRPPSSDRYDNTAGPRIPPQ